MKQINVIFITLLFIHEAVHTRGKLRIINGEKAPDDEYPWFYEGDGCGASLIAPDMLLTAAHCSSSFENSYYYIRFKHPQYVESETDVRNDFMVVKLKEPILGVTPVPMDDGNYSSSYDASKALWTLGKLFTAYSILKIVLFYYYFCNPLIGDV